MKKLMAICAATLMLAGVAASCSKVCECTASYGGYSYTDDVDLTNSGYKNCAAYANALEQAASVDGYTVTCKRK